jgi:hypothetical protein
MYGVDRLLELDSTELTLERELLDDVGAELEIVWPTEGFGGVELLRVLVAEFEELLVLTEKDVEEAWLLLVLAELEVLVWLIELAEVELVAELEELLMLTEKDVEEAWLLLVVAELEVLVWLIELAELELVELLDEEVLELAWLEQTY